MTVKDQIWDLVITPRRGLLQLQLRELWQFRYLVWMYVKRDFVSVYKQTILGPLWYLIQPLLTTVVFTIVFSDFANIATDQLPPFLFYLAGNTLWIYFSSCLTNTSETYTRFLLTYNKVYFPRLSIPISVTISSLASLGIRLFLLLGFLVYFRATGSPILPNNWVFIVPVLIATTAALSLALGLLITSLTVNYRDLKHLTTFGVQLLMYGTPIIYPLSSVDGNLRWLIQANPLTPLVEAFRYALLGAGTVSVGQVAYSVVFSIVLLVVALIIFNQVDANVVDTA